MFAWHASQNQRQKEEKMGDKKHAPALIIPLFPPLSISLLRLRPPSRTQVQSLYSMSYYYSLRSLPTFSFSVRLPFSLLRPRRTSRKAKRTTITKLLPYSFCLHCTRVKILPSCCSSCCCRCCCVAAAVGDLLFSLITFSPLTFSLTLLLLLLLLLLLSKPFFFSLCKNV